MASYAYLATVYRLTQALCRFLNRYWDKILLIPFSPAELAALTALKTACGDLLAQGPLPGTDDDPSTPT